MFLHVLLPAAAESVLRWEAMCKGVRDCVCTHFTLLCCFFQKIYESIILWSWTLPPVWLRFQMWSSEWQSEDGFSAAIERDSVGSERKGRSRKIQVGVDQSVNLVVFLTTLPSYIFYQSVVHLTNNVFAFIASASSPPETPEQPTSTEEVRLWAAYFDGECGVDAREVLSRDREELSMKSASEVVKRWPKLVDPPQVSY